MCVRASGRSGGQSHCGWTDATVRVPAACIGLAVVTRRICNEREGLNRLRGEDFREGAATGADEVVEVVCVDTRMIGGVLAQVPGESVTVRGS